VVKRALLVALVVAVALVALARFGGPLRAGPQPLSATDVQATSVRRTVVAEAQRIISNPPTPASTPQATPAPRPTCNDALWWHEARAHLGETRTVQGAVVGTRPAPNGGVLLEIGQSVTDPTSVGVLVPARLADGLQDKQVCAAGRIDSTEGRPLMVVQDPANLRVLAQ
jgi:hypothetical protein